MSLARTNLVCPAVAFVFGVPSDRVGVVVRAQSVLECDEPIAQNAGQVKNVLEKIKFEFFKDME